MSEFRRRLMMAAAQGGGGGTDYVKNGLVLHLDGIDKGNVNGSWIDLINGYEFVGSNITFGTDYMQFNGSSSCFICNTTDDIVPATEDGTIEVVFVDETDTQSPTYVLFMPNNSNRLALGAYQGKYLVSSSNNISFVVVSKYGTVSVNNENGYQNGVLLRTSSRNYWGTYSSNNIYIGRRYSGNYFKGKIYSIRLYNRKLTEAEVLQNYAVDVNRFALN